MYIQIEIRCGIESVEPFTAFNYSSIVPKIALSFAGKLR